MIEEQKIISIELQELVEKVKEMHSGKYRLAQIGCTRSQDSLEVNYSFDRNYNFVSLRVRVPFEGGVIPSVSKIYWSAFLYENEMQDLFGVKVKDIALDYKGTFYKTAIKQPFNPLPPKKDEA